jgi:hypothetical protein
VRQKSAFGAVYLTYFVEGVYVGGWVQGVGGQKGGPHLPPALAMYEICSSSWPCFVGYSDENWQHFCCNLKNKRSKLCDKFGSSPGAKFPLWETSVKKVAKSLLAEDTWVVKCEKNGH